VPEIPNVIPGEPVASEWGNDIRDRTLQRYSGTTQRGTLNPTPAPGDFSYLADTGAVEVFHSGVWRSMLPTGVVLPFAGGTVPSGFLVCNGALISRTTYPGLFAAIGTTFGAGDGTTTFALPDLRQRFPLGVAASGVGNALGAVGGQIDHVHVGGPHFHNVPGHSHDMGTSDPSGNAPTTSAGAHTHTVPNTSTGGSHTHSFSDTTGNPSVLNTSYGSGGLAATSNHTHSVSGSTGSSGSHAHSIGDTDSAGAHTHTAPAHQHTLGTTPVSGTLASGTAGGVNTGSGNPPFLALHFIIRT
jgi:microcystin-dependent protein